MSTPNGTPNGPPNGSAKVTVEFLHPRSSQAFRAEVGPATTGQQALDGLARASFIDPAGSGRAYALQHVRTGRTVPLSASLAGSGVQDQDQVAVTETSAGAGR